MKLGRKFSTLLLFSVIILAHNTVSLAQENNAEQVKPLRALLVTGGCCHDYPRQIEIITKGLSQRVNIVWEVFHGAVDGPGRLAIYQTDHWTEGYDIIVHNECYGQMADAAFVERIVKGHTDRGVPAVVIHCSMHSYRNAPTDEWRKLIGMTTNRHEQGGRRLDVVKRAPNHPIMQGFPGSWKTPNGELYVIERSWPETEVLATAYGIDTQVDHPVIWTNTYGKVRVFGTTLGHHNETMMSTEWLDVVGRGLLWACDKLQNDGSPTAGYGGTGVGPLPLSWLPVESTGEPTPAKQNAK